MNTILAIAWRSIGKKVLEAAAIAGATALVGQVIHHLIPDPPAPPQPKTKSKKR